MGFFNGVWLVNMYKIIIILLLTTGVFSSLDNDATENVKQDEVNNDELVKAAASSETDTSNEKAITEENTETVKPKPKTKKAPVLLDKQQINMLAEKVIRIHGVEPESDDEENQKNIDSLRQIVANVEKNLNEKLKLSQTRNTNLNAENAVTGSQSPLSQTAQNQNNNKASNDNLEQNAEESEEIRTETNIHDQAEKKTKNENLDTQSNTETVSDAKSEKSESVIEENEKTNKKREVKLSGKESDEKEQQVDADEGIDESNIENNEDVSEASTTENGRYEVDTINSEENEDINEDIVKEDTTETAPSDLQSHINENIKVETSPTEDTDDDISPDDTVDENITEKPEDKFENNNINDDIHAETNGTEYVRPEVEKYYIVVEDIAEKVAEYETAQNTINDDKNETSYTQSGENDESNVKNTEDEISGACSLNDECDQADITKIHVYSEEYNSETVTEEKLETKTEDSHLQRLIKFISSIF